MNVEHRIMYSTIYNKDKATDRLVWASQQKDEEHWVRLAMAGRSAFNIRHSTFDVKIIASEITTKSSYHVEIRYTGQEVW